MQVRVGSWSHLDVSGTHQYIYSTSNIQVGLRFISCKHLAFQLVYK